MDSAELSEWVSCSTESTHAISDAIVDTFDRLYPDAVEPGRAWVAHIGGADHSSATATEWADPLMVLFVGPLEERKGIDTILDAAVQLLGADSSVRIVVSGAEDRPGQDGLRYRDAWKRADHEGGDRLCFVGAVDDDELNRLIGESSVAVMQSRYESFGVVVVEAMMHCRAVVASDVGGIAELVIPGETGLLTPVADADRGRDPAARTLRSRSGPASPASCCRLDRACERNRCAGPVGSRRPRRWRTGFYAGRSGRIDVDDE